MFVASLSVNGFSSLLAGLRSGVTFVVALGCAGLLAQFSSAPHIFIALVASLVAAGMTFLLAVQGPFYSGYSTLDQLATHLLDFLAAVTGLWIILNVVPATASFVCQPMVPWQLSIALFGAFGMSWLSAAMRIQVPHIWPGLIIHVAFFWIAPFYGFFHAPWFLAQTVILPCDGRPLPQAVTVVLGMIVSTVAGRRAAMWMLGS